MPRPIKETVDYFQHDTDASHKKTLRILYNHFEHEGVSAWWQLLEYLGRTRQHFIDIRKPEDLEDFSSDIHFKPERLTVILTKMADLGAIDKPLFEHGIIWSENFVYRLKELYASRGQNPPAKPLLSQFIGLSVPETALPVPETGLSVPETALSGRKPNINSNSRDLKEKVTINTNSRVKETRLSVPETPLSVPETPVSSLDNSLSREFPVPETGLLVPETGLFPRKPNLENPDTENGYHSLFDYWNTQKIIVHQKANDSMRKAVKHALKEYTEEQIKTAISNYSEIVNAPKIYFFKHRWTFDEFLSRGIEKFLNHEIACNNYKKDDKKVFAKNQEVETEDDDIPGLTVVK